MHWRKQVLTLVLFVAAASSTAGFAADTLENGSDWQKWSSDAKVAYVSAYVRGQSRGFRDGCVAGQGLYSAKVKGLPGEKCLTKVPTYSKPFEDYAAEITEYYKLFPSDKGVPLFKILEGLSDARALTLRQMHQYFPSSSRR